jgi:hypothetical protein
MNSQLSSALLISESVQIAIRALSFLIVVPTLNEAIKTRRRVLANGDNHGADVFSLTALRGRVAFLFVEAIMLAMAVDRCRMLLNSYVPDYWLRFILFGAGQTVASMLVAWTAWSNMRAYRGLRDGE